MHEKRSLELVLPVKWKQLTENRPESIIIIAYQSAIVGLDINVWNEDLHKEEQGNGICRL